MFPETLVVGMEIRLKVCNKIHCTFILHRISSCLLESFIRGITGFLILTLPCRHLDNKGGSHGLEGVMVHNELYSLPQ